MFLEKTFLSKDDIALAELIKKHPCLFNIKHELYNDQTTRDDAWKTISNELKRTSKYLIFLQ